MINLIVPAYNSSSTLPDTLHSLGAQSVKNKFICTIIDDASTEDLSPIIKKFDKDFPIRYIKLKENKGVSNARQVGLDTTMNCEYVMFCDSDDMLTPYAIEFLNYNIQAKKYDVVTSNFISQSNSAFNVVNGEGAITWFHGKIYSYEFIKKFNITMPPTKLNEDSCFNAVVFNLTGNKYHLPEVTYLWRNNKQSLSRQENFSYLCLPDYVRSQEHAYTIIKRHKSLLDPSGLPATIIRLYYDLPFVEQYHSEELTKELIDTIKNFFKTVDLQFLIQDEGFREKLQKAFISKPTRNCVPTLGLYDFLKAMEITVDPS